MRINEKEAYRIKNNISLIKLRKLGFNKQEESVFDKKLISKRECNYLYDIATNQITHQLGFKELLGYESESLSINFRYSIVHSEDIGILNRVEQAALKFCIDNDQNCFDNILFITFRLKKKDGTYIKVLRKSSIYSRDIFGKPKSILMTHTDISFIDSSKQIKWVFEGAHIDTKGFREQIYKDYQNFFTPREKEIIHEIDKGCTNQLISKNLSISKHTVATHRKSILKKCNCHTSSELILFCKNNGIL